MKKLFKFGWYLIMGGAIFAAGMYIGGKPGIVAQGVSVLMPERELTPEVIGKMINDFRKNERDIQELTNHNGLNKMAETILKTFNDQGKIGTGAFEAITRSDDNSDNYCPECYSFAQNAAMDFSRADKVMHRWTTTDRASLRNLRDPSYSVYGIAMNRNFVVVIFGALNKNQQ